MRIYVFLTNTLGGYSGGPSYVRNKTIWLEQKGWTVVAFDSTGQANAPIMYSELMRFNDNRIKELYYHPSWFTSRRRNGVINKIISIIFKNIKDTTFNDIVIESNTIALSQWGELLSNKLKIKHLIYLLGENVIIKDRNEFLFLNHKYKNNEIFSISPVAFRSLWQNFMKIDDPTRYYWNAMSQTIPIDIDFDFENLSNADYTIAHFGRYKKYVPNMINEIIIFAKNNCKNYINLIMFGMTSLPDGLKSALEKCESIRLYFFDSVYPIPKKLFKISDVVIAAAGCALISANEGVKTISYDVQTNFPIGIMRYTTVQHSFNDQVSHKFIKPLHILLQDVLIKRSFDYPPILDLPDYDKGYEYHMSFVNNDVNPYMNVLSISYYNSLNGILQIILCRLGLVNVASFFRYLRAN